MATIDITNNHATNMKKKLAVSLTALSLLVGPLFASANHSDGNELEESHATTKHEDHVDATIPTIALTSAASVEQLEVMIKLLTQLLELLTHQAGSQAEVEVENHDDDSDHDDDADMDEDEDDDHDEDHDEDEEEDDEDHH